MKLFIVVCALTAHGLSAAAWDLDQETKDLFDSQIEASYQKHRDQAIAEGKKFYLLDLDRKILNFYNTTCSYCQDDKKTSPLDFEKQLSHFHFTKKWPSQPKAHCFGATLFLVQYLLSHPQTMMGSCADILYEISNAPDFEEKAHFFSLNQHSFYIFQDSKIPLELNPEAMKQYFQALSRKVPSDYFVWPLSKDDASIDKVSLYAILKSLPNKLIFIGYSKKDASSREVLSNHCIAVSTYPDKLFVFDSNLGMYQFPDLETLSRDSANVLKKERFRWLASFSLEENH